MKNKIAVIVLIIVIVAAAVLIGFNFFQKNKLPDQTGGNNQTGNEQSEEHKLITEDFDITLPAGWQQTTPPSGASAMAVNSNEEVTDPAAKKINFRTYLGVSYDTLEGKTLDEYMQSIKGQLQQALPGTVFSQEHDAVINSRAARAFEVDLTQQGASFKILIVAIKGEGDDVWTMSFNTLQSSWMAYQETFSGIANSFKLKI